MSPSEFRNYYENTHMPLLLSLTGSFFPTSHTRHYLPRTLQDPSSSDATNTNHIVTAYAGKVEDFEYDVYAELVFESAEKFEAFARKLGEIEAAEDGVFYADELAFLDLSKSKSVAIDEPVVTVAPSVVG
ncbi:hypothetical protein LSUE1_G001145 [Lachnellula suecica]|uniref:EthD domain-containing protein n=1 Tax=Lachnellula suecica TaxID=602035 RepID=A0A8T9CJ14_9HELO|nr:hypothetical protein LSUE1_G001145 [Lachnellula suecica]